MNFHDAILEVKKAFPELRSELNKHDRPDLFHNAFGIFATFTQQLINGGNREQVSVAFDLANRFLLQGNPKLKNAIYVSFLEHLNFGNSDKNSRSWAKQLMPPALQQGYQDINNYLDGLFSKKK